MHSSLSRSHKNSVHFGWTSRIQPYILADKTELKLRKNKVANSFGLLNLKNSTYSDAQGKKKAQDLVISDSSLKREQKPKCAVEIGATCAAKPYDSKH